MQDIVSKVLAAEKQAEEMLREARGKVTAIRGKADTESAEILEAARTEAHALTRATIAEAREEAAKADDQARTKAAGESLLAEKSAEIKETVAKVVELITHPEYAKE